MAPSIPTQDRQPKRSTQIPETPRSTYGMPPAPTQEVEKRQAAREVIDILHEIATLLNTHLNRQQLSYCVSLIENGVNPEALANVIKDLRNQYPEPPEIEDEEKT